MGAGRKTFTYDVDSRGQEAFSLQSFENSQRNLEEELGGCIFGASCNSSCKKATLSSSETIELLIGHMSLIGLYGWLPDQSGSADHVVPTGCTHETYDECVNNLIFGLPRAHWCYVQHIKKG